MKKQEEKSNQVVEFSTQKEITKQLAFELDMEGSKTFFVLENGQEICFFNSGLSGQAIVNLVMCLAVKYTPFFDLAIEALTDPEQEMIDQKESESE